MTDYMMPDTTASWDPETYAYVDRCRLAAIAKGESRQEFLGFVRELYSVKGFDGVVAHGEQRYSVSRES